MGHIGVITLPLTIDPNFLGHPSVMFRTAEAVSRNGEKHRVMKQRGLSPSAQIVFGFQDGFRWHGSGSEFRPSGKHRSSTYTACQKHGCLLVFKMETSYIYLQYCQIYVF